MGKPEVRWPTPSIQEWLKTNYPRAMRHRKSKFTKAEKYALRPIAEVLAIMDGNCFFGISTDEAGNDNWYEQYLPEAWAIYKAHDGAKGWIAQSSWMRDLDHENDSVKNAWENWRLIKMLSKRPRP